jgi:hypothetical protein
MTVQPDGQQPDGGKLGGGAIASLTGVGVLWPTWFTSGMGRVAAARRR